MFPRSTSTQTNTILARIRRGALSAALVYLLILALMFVCQRGLLYFPSHEDRREAARAFGLHPWLIDGNQVGMKRECASPGRVWLFAHGNGGQAADRAYALPYFEPTDSVYIVEYPGFGLRPGSPCEESINAAVTTAYEKLLTEFGPERIFVLGESLGSGPASRLGAHRTPPAGIVLVVPYDDITRVAQAKFPFLPVRLIMRDRWNNLAALAGYRGRLDIWAAEHDSVIPVDHARHLAQALPQARYHEFPGDHGWANGRHISLRE